jgi:hypothetical protein
LTPPRELIIRSRPSVRQSGHDSKHVYKMDIRAFFPSISREKVYYFFRDNLRTSPDIADALTSFTTIDLRRCNNANLPEVEEFLAKKGIRTTNHLISGSPASPILSFLVNLDMFDELYTLSVHHSMTMTVYMDDITFSSDNRISNRLINGIHNIISKYNYVISSDKAKMYTKSYPKEITGTIIDKTGNLVIPNRLRYKIIQDFKKLRANPYNETLRQQLHGRVSSARQIVPSAFPSIYRYVRYAQPTSDGNLHLPRAR